MRKTTFTVESILLFWPTATPKKINNPAQSCGHPLRRLPSTTRYGFYNPERIRDSNTNSTSVTELARNVIRIRAQERRNPISSRPTSHKICFGIASLLQRKNTAHSNWSNRELQPGPTCRAAADGRAPSDSGPRSSPQKLT